MKFNLGDRVLYRDTGREAVVLLYRPFPKPEYGVEGNVPSRDVVRMYLTMPDGIARDVLVRWVSEDDLKPLFPQEIMEHWTGKDEPKLLTPQVMSGWECFHCGTHLADIGHCPVCSAKKEEFVTTDPKHMRELREGEGWVLSEEEERKRLYNQAFMVSNFHVLDDFGPHVEG